MQIPTGENNRELAAVVRTCVRRPGLDAAARRDPRWANGIADALSQRSELAWRAAAAEHAPEVLRARLETQRALYEINRLRLYWLDDPTAYANERSGVLADWQARIEAPWQAWLERQVPEDVLTVSDPRAQLLAWAARDRNVPEHGESEDSTWIAERMSRRGYRRLLEIISLNALVEASQLSRALGGAADAVQTTLFRILMEEYGAGRLDKKHSSFFARMLQAEGMRSEPEAYLHTVPWEVLSVINQAFHLAENKRLYLRFCGSFTYTELSTVVGFRAYARAARRLGLSDGQSDYWSLHVREDERHGRWMLEQVALPLLARFAHHSRDLLLGYAQQRVLERLAGAAVARACRAAEQQEVS